MIASFRFDRTDDVACTGILNNELYIGQLVWNRLAYIKNPDTGKRVSRLNDKSALIITDVPELCIIDQYLWERVKEREQSLRKVPWFHEKQRPRMLLPTEVRLL